MSNLLLPKIIRGINIYQDNIPTGCSLRTMLQKLIETNGNTSEFKKWELNCFDSYNLEPIKSKLVKCENESERIGIIKEHILDEFPINFGRNLVTIYLVAYIAETYGSGRPIFMGHLLPTVSNEGSRQVIRNVGLGHGIYLGILNSNGSMRDFNFFKRLIEIR